MSIILSAVWNDRQEWPKRKERRTKAPLQRPRPRGTNEQHLADAPSRGGRAKHCFSSSRAERRLRLVVSLKADLTLSRRSNCLHGRSTALWSFLCSVLPLLQVGLVGFPASFQSSNSIIEGREGRNYPSPQFAAGHTTARPASCQQPFDRPPTASAAWISAKLVRRVSQVVSGQRALLTGTRQGIRRSSGCRLVVVRLSSPFVSWPAVGQGDDP